MARNCIVFLSLWRDADGAFGWSNSIATLSAYLLTCLLTYLLRAKSGQSGFDPIIRPPPPPLRDSIGLTAWIESSPHHHCMNGRHLAGQKHYNNTASYNSTSIYCGSSVDVVVNCRLWVAVDIFSVPPRLRLDNVCQEWVTVGPPVGRSAACLSTASTLQVWRDASWHAQFPFAYTEFSTADTMSIWFLCWSWQTLAHSYTSFIVYSILTYFHDLLEHRLSHTQHQGH